MAVALGKDALGLEQKRLAEALGSDDDELVIAPRSQECIDFGGSVEQRLVEILRYADVIGVNSPSPHGNTLDVNNRTSELDEAQRRPILLCARSATHGPF